MNNLASVIELFATISGIIYIILEIKQKNIMWYVGIVTVTACAISFGIRGQYASMLLNIYYIGVSVWGLYQWKKDEKLLDNKNSEHKKVEEVIHLNRLTVRTIIYSILFLIFGLSLIYGLDFLLRVKFSIDLQLHFLDVFAAIIAVIGTLWLARAYWEQWVIWIICDILYSFLCFNSNMNFMGFLYVVYTLGAFYGLYHWYSKGTYIDKDVEQQG